MRRGEIRFALLSVLSEGPGHGYELIGRLEEKTGGVWRPSPGSVYPTLQLLEDEGLVRSETRDGKRVYELTDAGRAEVERRARARARRGRAWETRVSRRYAPP
jgi:DNA-binding PadR family transcriptional regulator